MKDHDYISSAPGLDQDGKKEALKLKRQLIRDKARYEMEFNKLLDDTLRSIEDKSHVKVKSDGGSAALLGGDLSSREKRILTLSFGIGCKKLTMREISKVFGGLTNERIKFLRERALGKLPDGTRRAIEEKY